MPINQGSPSPKNTFTELEPITFPTAASAESASCAALIEANVSGSEVPSATNVIAVTLYFKPSEQPNQFAASPTIAVTSPIMDRATPKVTHPFL